MITVELTVEDVQDIGFALDSVRLMYEINAVKDGIPAELRSKWIERSAHFGVAKTAFMFKCFPMENKHPAEEGET